MKLFGTYDPTKWDENTIQVIQDRMKLTKATVEFTFAGDIEGIAAVEYIMFYSFFDPEDAHKSQAEYVGLIRNR